MKKTIGLSLAFVLLLAALTAGCADSGSSEIAFAGTSSQETEQTVPESLSQTAAPEDGTSEEDNAEDEEEQEMKMEVQVGESSFTAVLEKNQAVEALVDMMKEAPVTIHMRDYAGFEKVGALGRSLPASNHQTTTKAGDLVLYQGNQIVMFYGSNSWSYTPLGHIADRTGWEEALGSGDVTVTFSLEQ